jgi:hypothetical protein
MFTVPKEALVKAEAKWKRSQAKEEAGVDRRLPFAGDSKANGISVLATHTDP